MIKWNQSIKTKQNCYMDTDSNKRESTWLKHFNDPKAFIECSNDIQDVYKNINEYNVDKECKILIVLVWFLIWLIATN